MQYLTLTKLTPMIKETFGISEATFKRMLKTDPKIPRYKIGKRWKYLVDEVFNYLREK